MSDDFHVNAGWERREGRTICRWIVVWKEIDDETIAGTLAGYSGGGSFQLEQFFAKHTDNILTHLMIDMEDKITGDEIDFFDDISSEALEICDDAQDIVLEWHDEEEWEEAEQLLLLDERVKGLDVKDNLLFLKNGDSIFLKDFLEKTGITAAPNL